MAIQSYLNKQEKHRINNLTTPKTTEKISRRKEIIKIRAEINEKEME